jgi:cytochrome bd-type quinol oxidase subunit 2
MKKDYWLYGLAVVTGVLVWIIVSNASGRREAWDSHWYFLISVLVVCVISAALVLLSRAGPGDGGSLLLLVSFPGCCSPKGRVISCHLGS